MGKLNSKDLMVDDWVEDIGPCYIDAVSNDDVCTYKSKDGYITANPSNLKPMAISFDILEKSGFQKKEMHTVKGQHYWLHVIFPESHVKIWPRELHDNPESGFVLYAETAKGTCRMSLKWVHELQHLLRLFDIDKQIIVL